MAAAPAPRPPLRPKRWLVWLRRMVGLGALGTLALASVLVAALLWLNSSAGLRRVLDRGVEAANGALLGTLVVGPADGHILSEFTVRHVVLLGPDGEELLAADSLTVLWQPLALLDRQARVDRVALHGVRGDLVNGPDGLNILSIFPPSDPDKEPSELPVSILVERIELTGDLTYDPDGPGESEPFAVADLETAAAFEMRGRWMEVAVERLLADVREPALGPIDLQGGVEMDDGAIPAFSLILHALGAEIGAGGRLGPTSAPDLDVHAVLADLDLDRLDALVEAPVTGTAGFDLTVDGTLDDLHVAGHLDVEESAADVDLHADLRAAPITWHGTVDLEQLDLASFLTVGPGMPGGPVQGIPSRVNGRITLRGQGRTPDELSGEVQADIDDSVLLGWHADRLALDVGIAPELALTIRSLALDAPLGSARLAGWSRVPDGRFGVEGTLAGIHLGRLGRRLGVDGLDGQAGGSMAVSGGWGSASGFWVDGEGEIAVDALQAPATTIARVTTTFDARYGATGLDGTVRGDAWEVQGGGIPLEQLSYRLNLARTHVDGEFELRFDEKITTQVRGRFDWSGPHPTVRADRLAFATWGSRWDTTAPCTITLLGDGAVHVDELDVLGEAGHLNITGTVAPRGLSDLTLAGKGFRLDALEPLLAESDTLLDGTIDIDLAFSGPPELPDVNLQVNGSGVRANEYGPFELSLGVVGGGGRTSVGASAGADAIEPLQLQGILPYTVALRGGGFDPEGLLHLYADIPLQDTSNLSTVIPQVASLPPSRFGITLTASGVGSHPEARAEVRLRDVRAVDLPTMYLDLEGSVGEDSYQATAELRNARDDLAAATVSGRFDLARLIAERVGGATPQATPYLGSAEAHIDLIALPVETLRLYTDAVEPLHGRLKGDVRVGGSSRDPRVTVDLRLVGGARVDDEYFDHCDLDATVEGGALALTLDAAGRNGWTLGANATSPLDLSFAEPRTTDERLGQPELVGTLQGRELPLSMLTAFADAVHASQGQVELDGSIRGTLLDPEPVVSVGLADGEICVEDLGVCYQDMALRARATPEDLLLQRLELTSIPAQDIGADAPDRRTPGEARIGTLTASGEMDLSGGLGQTTLDVEASDFWLTYNRQVKARADLGIRVRGHYPDLRVRGRVDVSLLKIEIGDEMSRSAWPMERDPDLVVHRGGQEAEPEEEGRRLAITDHLDVDIQVALARNSWLYLERSIPMGKIKPDIQFEGDLGLTMQDGSFWGRGEVRTVRGNLNVLGKQFKVDEGLVTLTGATPPDPQLDVTASYKSRHGDILLRVEGRASSPQLTFSSDEIADEADILSVLLFGAPMDEAVGGMTGGGGGDESAQFAAIGMMVGKQLGNAMATLVGHNAVDMVNLETGTAGPGTFGVEIGKALGERVFLITRYRYGVDEDENMFEGQLEFSVTRRLYIELRYGDANNGGVEVYVKWKL